MRAVAAAPAGLLGLLLCLLLQPREARADVLLFTDPAAYQAAIAQQGVTQNAVRFDDPTPVSTIVGGKVLGVTPSGQGDLPVIFSSPNPLAASGSPFVRVEGASGPLSSLNISLASPDPSAQLLPTFQSISGFVMPAPGQSGNLVLSARNLFNHDTTFLSLDISSGGSIFFGVLATGNSTLNSLSLFSLTNIQMSGVSQIGIGNAAAVPEPATLLLLVTGLAGVAGLSRRGRP
ncbi:MAG TPA: PEP-CTERM sorting domain-containing protein [Pyrinomonadaceae bacterium]|nr:PEP-CTERM sorting domain-containing protein [Pyrinomonadaceae bacterium]